jgi:hypothetical protein
MSAPALQRLESLLAARRLDGTLAQVCQTASVAALSTAVGPLDDALGGGWRLGEISEIVGPRSSGRAALLWATLAAATRDGHGAALVDTFDRFDPTAAAGAGIDLDRLLWVRGPAILAERSQAGIVATAVQRAVRALDLVVRAGGFAVAAIDLCDVPPRQIRALPAATWLRLAHANEGRKTACLIVGEAPVGRSARGATVQLSATRVWTGDSLQSRRLRGVTVKARIARMTLSARDAEWEVRSAS